MLDAAAALDKGWLPEPQDVLANDLPARFAYVQSPEAAANAGAP